MYPALLLLAAIPNWIPARWHSGDPATLDLLRGTPINCLLVAEPSWNPKFVKAAANGRIATLAVIRPGPRALANVERVRALHMDGIVLEGEFDEALSKSLRLAAGTGAWVELPNRRGIRLGSGDPITGTWQGVWPGIEIEHGGTVARPTGSPWVHTNTGFLGFLRAVSDGAVWIGVSPPPNTVFTAERYLQVLADAALAGARWIVDVDEDLRSRLMRREPEALRAWEVIGRQLRYFEDHPEWREFKPFSSLGVVEDSASGALLSGSLIDMLTAQRTGARVIPTSRLDSTTLRGIRVLLNLDPGALSPGQQRDLDQFARSGGAVVNPPASWRFPPTGERQFVLTARQAGELQDLWELVHKITVRKNFATRTFNTTGMLSTAWATPGGKSMLIHLLNYTDYPVESVTVQALGTWKRARLYTPDGAVTELPVYPVSDGTGMDIERVSVLATVRVD